jgi:D-alanine--poly(phosphoribitol) ligase subunit 2
MNTQQAILKAMEDILGLNAQEMRENLDIDLFDSGLVDSLALVSLITQVETSIGRKIDIKRIEPESFLTINRLSEAIDKQA